MSLSRSRSHTAKSRLKRGHNVVLPLESFEVSITHGEESIETTINNMNIRHQKCVSIAHGEEPIETGCRAGTGPGRRGSVSITHGEEPIETG